MTTCEPRARYAARRRRQGLQANERSVLILEPARVPGRTGDLDDAGRGPFTPGSKQHQDLLGVVVSPSCDGPPPTIQVSTRGCGGGGDVRRHAAVV